MSTDAHERPQTDERLLVVIINRLLLHYNNEMLKLIQKWYLLQRLKAWAQARLRICAVSTEPLLSTPAQLGNRGRFKSNLDDLVPLDNYFLHTG